jgi:hypothetical protein
MSRTLKYTLLYKKAENKHRFVQYKPTRCTIFQLYFDIQLYMFRTDWLSIIRSLDTAFTVIGMCRTGYIDCLLWVQFQDSWWWTISQSETRRVVYQNKIWEIVHLVGFYYTNMSRCTVLWMSNRLLRGRNKNFELEKKLFF